MAVKYYCDRCNDEVKGPSYLKTIAVAGSHTKAIVASICFPCVQELNYWLSTPPNGAALADAEPRASRL